jgi:division protein CdvB (Snf7/Vps24/ESCRT-III family)
VGVVLLSHGFSERWEGKTEGLKGYLNQTTPLKDRLEGAIRRIESQLSKINGFIEYYSRREKELSEKVVHAYERHDEARAKIFANELAEVRKHKDLLINSKLSLDRAALRIRTIYEFGNFASAVSSAKKIVGEVREGVSNLMPGVSSEFSQIENMLETLITEVGQNTCENLNFNLEGEEAEKILEEAKIVAKNRVAKSFPEFPKSEDK